MERKTHGDIIMCSNTVKVYILDTVGPNWKNYRVREGTSRRWRDYGSKEQELAGTGRIKRKVAPLFDLRARIKSVKKGTKGW